MAKTEHTPTPWKTKPHRGDPDTVEIISASGLEIALGVGADCAFIVRAVNAHDAWVEALEALFKECAMTHKHWGDGCNQREADEAIGKALAALKLAKGA